MAMDGYKGFLGLLVSALLVGFLSVIFTLVWVLHYREGLGWDGTALEFNWHPVLMVTGFVFIQGIGTGHLLGGSGEGRAGRGPGPIALRRVGPTWASEGVRGAREPRGVGNHERSVPGAETAGRGGGTGSGVGGAQTRDSADVGWRALRPWGGARGPGIAARRFGGGAAEHRRSREGGPLRRRHLLNSLLRVAGAHSRYPPDTRNRNGGGRLECVPSPLARKIAPCGRSLRHHGHRDALQARPFSELSSGLQVGEKGNGENGGARIGLFLSQPQS